MEWFHVNGITLLNKLKLNTMKTIKYLVISFVGMLFFASCNKNEVTEGDGKPVMTAESEISSAMFGDSLTFKFNVSDEGDIPLSTLKAKLYFGDEVVSQTVIRTKTYGEYTGKIYVPFYKNIPNATATLKFTLQNIHFTTTDLSYNLPVTRPQYNSLTLVTDNGNYTMTPSGTDPYQFSCSLTSASKSVKGYIVAPAMGTYGNQINFGLSGSDVSQGSVTPITFTNSKAGTFTVSFNTYSYAYAPKFEPKFNGTLMTYKDDNNYYYYGTLTQGQIYTVSGSDEIAADSWYYDPDFFTKNSDGTFTFNAITGLYKVTANFKYNYFQVYAMTDANTTAILKSDGSGALWIIGSGDTGKPNYTNNGINWSTDKALCLAQIQKGIYQLTLVAGSQQNTSSLNFKFFHQNTWGNEFDGAATSTYKLTTSSTLVLVGDGTNGYDNGNIYLQSGVTLESSSTYVFKVDCTSGIANAVLTVTKK